MHWNNEKKVLKMLFFFHAISTLYSSIRVLITSFLN